MSTAVTVFLTTMAGFMAASSSFWIYIRNKDLAKQANTRLLMGLAQDKIVHLSVKYIERGWITADEYEHLRDYLYAPYVELGGNGTAERIIHLVENLPLHPEEPIHQGLDVKSDDDE